MENFYAVIPKYGLLVELEEYCDPFYWDKQCETFESYEHFDLAHYIDEAMDPGDLTIAQIAQMDIDVSISQAMESHEYARFLFYIMEHLRNFSLWSMFGDDIEDIVPEGRVDEYIGNGYEVVV